MLPHISHHKKVSSSDYLILCLMLLFLVNPFFKFYKFSAVFLVVLFTLRTFQINRSKHLIQPILFQLFIIYILLALIQGVFWGFSIVSVLSSFTIGFLLPYLIFLNYGIFVFHLLEKIIYYLTFFALVIWTGLNISDSIRGELIFIIDSLHSFSSDSSIDDNMKRSLVFYTFDYEGKPMSNGLYRNAGFAHEPGAFALFLCFAIYLNLLKGMSLLSFRIVIYIIAVITTFSTAGFLSLFALILPSLLKGRKYFALAVVLLPIFFIFAYRFYITSEFLGQKIEKQLYTQSTSALDKQTTGRFYGARKSLYVLQKYPLYGRGLLTMTKPSSFNHPEYAAYGWLSELSRFGAVVGLIGLFFFIKGFINFSKLVAANNMMIIFGLFSFFINLSAQVFITNPIFFVFFFMGLSKPLNFIQTKNK